MQGTSLLTVKDIQEWNINMETENGWVPARPLGYLDWVSRFKIAWMVFTGKADAITWPNKQ